jgi:hypothetical protein
VSEGHGGGRDQLLLVGLRRGVGHCDLGGRGGEGGRGDQSSCA